MEAKVTRRRYVQDSQTGTLVEVSVDYLGTARGTSGLVIMPDIPPFVSPVDGTEVTGRRALREHNLRNEVTNVSDYTETWKKAEKVRESRMNGTFDAPSIKESLIREFNRRGY
jgi:hypothetical protein